MSILDKLQTKSTELPEGVANISNNVEINQTLAEAVQQANHLLQQGLIVTAEDYFNFIQKFKNESK